MQFSGKVSSQGVHLVAQKMPAGYPHNRNGDVLHSGHMESPEIEFTCPTCGRKHGLLHTFIRKPRGMCGCWVVFQYNGEEHVPDLSVPLSLDRLPKDAVAMTEAESAEYWHK